MEDCMTEVSVKPKRTFWHDELKTKRSPAFDVEVGVAHEMKELGLVDIEGAVEAAEIEAEVDEDAIVEEPVVAVVPVQKKKGKANAIDKDS
jgi:hypothetical protein